MRRGEIWLVDFEPSRAEEADKRRPAIIVTNDGANVRADQLGRGVITVVPLTSKVDRVQPFHVLLPSTDTGLPRNSKAQAEQVMSVAVARVGMQIGRVPHDLMDEVDEALRLHLAL
jgi:mRNA interferase MazF